MKAVLMSIKPKYCELISSGKKTVEVRKTKPNLETPFKCYIYCTLKGSNEFFRDTLDGDIAKWNKGNWGNKKGKVIGEFVCDGISGNLVGYRCGVEGYWGLKDGTCLRMNELMNYGRWKTLYGWHISDLVIYDKPKSLSDFRLYDCRAEIENGYPMPTHKINRPPQSWYYVEEMG